MDEENGIPTAQQAIKSLQKADKVFQKIRSKEAGMMHKFADELEHTIVASTSKNKLFKLRDALELIRENKLQAKLRVREAKKILRLAEQQEKKHNRAEKSKPSVQ